MSKSDLRRRGYGICNNCVSDSAANIACTSDSSVVVGGVSHFRASGSNIVSVCTCWSSVVGVGGGGSWLLVSGGDIAVGVISGIGAGDEDGVGGHIASSELKKSYSTP